MAIKISNQPQWPIGRNLQFNIPLLGSNKKHYWASGQGNLGFLTSQQIQILKQMKKREIDMRALNHLRPSYDNAEMSLQSFKKYKNFHKNDPYELSKKSRLKQLSTPKNRNNSKNMNIQKKRFFSHSRKQNHQENSQSSNSSRNNVPSSKHLKTIDTANKPKKQFNNKRIKTLQIEKLYNPEGMTYKQQQDNIQTQQQAIKNFKKKLRSRIDIHSSSVNVKVNPESHSESKKDLRYQKSINKISNSKQDFDIQKSQINLKLLSKLTKGNQTFDQKRQDHTQPLIYKSQKFHESKVHTRGKLRREFSPTYCNSVDYPLSCFRYV